MKWFQGLLFVVGALALFTVLAGQMGFLRGKPPSNLGVREGRLKPPSKTPNSVSSQADLWPDAPQRDYARIAALPLRGDAPQTMQRLQTLVAAMPGARIVRSEGDYLYAEFSTRLLKYTDDLELWAHAGEGVVHVRSASRLGQKDFGVNRARVETLRAALAAQP